MIFKGWCYSIGGHIFFWGGGGGGTDNIFYAITKVQTHGYEINREKVIEAIKKINWSRLGYASPCKLTILLQTKTDLDPKSLGLALFILWCVHYGAHKFLYKVQKLLPTTKEY